jgi:phospholipase C
MGGFNMRTANVTWLLLLANFFVCSGSAQAINFKHVILIIQENRTPDNLFQGLCVPPFGNAASCSATPSATQYNIETRNWLNNASPTGITQPGIVPLAGTYDLDHSPSGFQTACDKDTATRLCRMDGAAGLNCSPNAGTVCPSIPAFRYVDNSIGLLNPYLKLATQYGWANHFHQTNQGPSFPAHQYLFGATSAPTAGDDAVGIFASGNGSATGINLTNNGCESNPMVSVPVVGPGGKLPPVYPCFEHQIIPDLLPSHVTWRYYAQQLGIWIAPIAIEHVCGPQNEVCKGVEWIKNVDLVTANILRDIAACNLRSMSWVIPIGQNSDHPSTNTGTGPSWVSSIVNAIGENTTCDGAGYWKDTAILIVWDDWGGWYDHEAPPANDSIQSDYERGFRVPFIFVSAYTPKSLINYNQLDFGAISRFIEQNFGVTEGRLGLSDSRTASDLRMFPTLKVPRSFVTIQASVTANFFLNDKRMPTPPDDD